MSLLKVSNSKAIENVNGENYHHGAMFVNSNNFTNTLTLNTNENGLIIGPVTAVNVTVNGNLTVNHEINVTGDINVIGTLKFLG